jgi:hypothetical protein
MFSASSNGTYGGRDVNTVVINRKSEAASKSNTGPGKKGGCC